MLQALTTLRGMEADQRTLATMAIEVEQGRLNETVGCQDQVAAAFGGLNIINFRQDGTFDVNPIRLSAQRESDLVARLMLFYPGRSRFSSEIASSFMRNLPERSNSVRRMVTMVDEGADILREGDLDDFGRLLHETWEIKRGLTDQVSSDEIDDLYARARRAGALGGKLLGAGGAGFILLYVPIERQDAVMTALTPQCINVPFTLDHEGARIIYRANGI
jgi:D-glycero-alpha-D-manno-heptose-7-phosphate kinase